MKIFTKILLISLLMCSFFTTKGQQKPGLVIHGGAGNISRENLDPEQEKLYRQKMEEALLAGWKILEEGGSSLDAITIAIRIMEESPLFNASRGSVFTKEGTIELDASIMDGRTGSAEPSRG